MIFKSAMVSVCVLLILAPFSCVRGEEEDELARQAEHGELLTSLAELHIKVSALERLLGGGDENLDLTAPATLADAYAQLRKRVESLAEASEGDWRHIPTLAPVSGGRISSPYTPRRWHPIQQRVQSHFGLDIAVPHGTPVRAAADGEVRAVANTPSYGLVIDLDHGNGFVTRYAHASRIHVRGGDTVSRGDVIADVGATGQATGPHLHYEVFFEGWSVDPVDFMLDGTLTVGDAPGGGSEQ